MDAVMNDRFLVWVRSPRDYTTAPEEVEHVVGECSTYAEARRIRGEYLASARECVIRYVGEAGGGD